MKRLLFIFTIVSLGTLSGPLYAGPYVAGPGSIAFVDTGTGLHTTAGWGYWSAAGGIKSFSIFISNTPPVNDRMTPIFTFMVAPWKNAFVIRGLPPGVYYCVVWPNGNPLWPSRTRSSGAHRFVCKKTE